MSIGKPSRDEQMTRTSERVMPAQVISVDDRLIYLRHLYVYEFVSNLVSKNSRVLDLGCGEGYGAAMLADRAASVIGVDVDEDTIVRASRLNTNIKCSFTRYDGQTLPFGDGSFDTVVAVQVIEHIRDSDRFLAESERVLTNGGMAIIATPNRTIRLRPGERPWNRYHVREYDHHQLEMLCRAHFSSVQVSGVFGNAKIMSIERERLTRIRRLAALDPFRVMRFIPVQMKSVLTRLGRRTIKQKGLVYTPVSYSTTDFHVNGDYVDESLDLICVAIVKR